MKNAPRRIELLPRKQTMIDTILVVDEYDTHRVGLANVLRTGADVIAAQRQDRAGHTPAAWDVCSTSTCPT